jgi:hypothetical protein
VISRTAAAFIRKGPAAESSGALSEESLGLFPGARCAKAGRDAFPPFSAVRRFFIIFFSKRSEGEDGLPVFRERRAVSKKKEFHLKFRAARSEPGGTGP